MKIAIYLSFFVFFVFNTFAQSFDILLNDNGLDIHIYRGNHGEYQLIDKLNPIDSSYYFKYAVGDNYNLDLSDKSIEYNIYEGKLRGVDFVNLSIPSSSLEKLSFNLNIKISYDFKNSKVNNIIDFDQEFFEDFDNKNHIQFLRNKHITEKLQSSDWFNPGSDFVKVFTSNDAPSFLLVSDVFSIFPNWKNKSTKNLIMYQRGKEIPIFIKDDDNLINENDTIFFMGSRAFGDTTYFENYTNKEAFFLTFNENLTGTRLSLKDVSYVTGEILDKVYIDKHIEKDVKYSTGSLFISDYFTNQIEKSNHFDTRTVMGEGWFWDILTPRANGLPNDTTKGAFFVNYQNINPTNEDSDSLTIKLIYRTLQDSINRMDPLPQRLTHYHLLVDINNQIKERKFDGYRFDSLTISLDNKSIYNGHNSFKAIHKEFYSTTNSSVLIDYFKLEGKVKSVAENGNLDFKISDNFKHNLELSNFNSNQIILINKDESTISFANASKKGFYVRASSDMTFNNFVTMSINDSVVSAFGNGLHFFVCKAPEYKEYLYISPKTNNTEILNLLNNLPDNSVIIVSNSGTSNNNSQLAQLISQLGANTNVENINGNWIFATLKGTNFKEEVFLQNDIAKLSKLIESPNGTSYSFKINLNSNKASQISISDLKSSEKVIPISVSKNNLFNIDDGISGFYITHKNFYNEIEKLKNYREKSQNIKVKLIDVEDIYNHFNYGNESPHAIKNYLKYYNNSKFNLPKYLTLVGDASWDPRKVSQNSISNNYLPAYGNPVSDFWYGLLDGENDFDPEIIVGRISVKSNEEARNVVNKLIEYDTTAASEWMRRYLFLTGGLDQTERNRFYNHIGSFYSDYILDKAYCNNIDYVRKNENSPSSSSQGTEIREKINQGNIWTIYIGHAASEIFELDGWSAYSLNNKQKYGLLTTISCNTGAFAEPNLISCRNEEYLFVLDKGFIGVIGSTTLGFVAEHNFITSMMISQIADSAKKLRNLGELFYGGKTRMAKNSYQLFTLYHFSLLGDVFTQFRFGKKTDPYLVKDNISIKVDGEVKQATDKNSKITISGSILNYGYNTNKYFELRLRRIYNGKTDSTLSIFNELCSPKEFSFDLDIKDKPGIHIVDLIIDPDNILDEENDNNNKITLSIEVFKDGLIFLDPQSNWDLSRSKPIIRVLNPLDNNNLFDYYFSIKMNDGEPLKISNSKDQPSEFTIDEDYIDWKPDLSSIRSGSYLLSARSINKSDDKLSELITIPINIVDDFSSDKINYQLSTENDINFENVNNLEYSQEEEILKLKKYSLPFKTLSVAGIYDSNMVFRVRPYVNMEVGNKVFVQGYHDRGFNIGVFSATPNGISTRYKLFDTWGRDESHPESNWYKDSIAIDLVRFLRDSISENDYLFIGTSSSVFRLPVYFKIFAKEKSEGSVDTLLNVLRNYGSYIADTLVLDTNNQGFDISFTMVGYKGAKIGSIYEAIHMHGDSARTQGEIFIFDTQGKFTSQKIGESRKWNKVFLNGKFNHDEYLLNVKIYGIRENNSKNLVYDLEYQGAIDISQLSAAEYPYLQIECHYSIRDTSVKKMLGNQSMGISSIIVDFLPVDELALVKSETRILNNGELRGTPTELNIDVKNLSLRSDVDSVNTLITLRDAGNTKYDYNLKIDKIAANSRKNKSIFIETDYLQPENYVFVNLNNELKPKEKYYFNNNSNLLLNIKKDSIKPTVKLYIDDKLHQKDDYISKLPTFKVELYDNSPLPITDSNSITVRVNGYLHPYQRTLESKFERINDGSNLKAIFTFKPDTLQYEDVSIIIYYNDAEQNRDTLQSTARTSLYNAEITENIVYPNPATDNINFLIKYKAPDSEADAIIDIFDLNGSKVNSIKSKISIGSNIINFFAHDSQGNSLSSHLYFYKIQINSKYYVEPKYGKFIIVK